MGVTLVIFKREMVDRIVSGVKTQTRRRSKVTYKEDRVYQINLRYVFSLCLSVT